jgi:hypothetical protein
MKDFVLRMMKEEEDLAQKIEKLDAFLKLHKEELPLIKRNLMTIQLNQMIAYDLILAQRISIELEEEEKEKN